VNVWFVHESYIFSFIIWNILWLSDLQFFGVHDSFPGRPKSWPFCLLKFNFTLLGQRDRGPDLYFWIFCWVPPCLYFWTRRFEAQKEEEKIKKEKMKNIKEKNSEKCIFKFALIHFLYDFFSLFFSSSFSLCI